jgi:hypothetical protein
MAPLFMSLNSKLTSPMMIGQLKNMTYCMYIHLLLEGRPVHMNVIRCMEHSLHIASKHFVEAVAPASLTSIHKKVKAALVKAHNNGKLNLDEFDEALSWINFGNQNDGDGDDDDNDDDDSNFTPGDSLGKVLALVKQVQYPLCIYNATNPVSRFGCLLR